MQGATAKAIQELAGHQDLERPVDEGVEAGVETGSNVEEKGRGSR